MSNRELLLPLRSGRPWVARCFSPFAYGIVRYKEDREESKQSGMLDTDRKQTIIGEYRAHDKDTGSTEVQVALLTERINEISGHLRAHHSDHQSRRGLLQLVGQRRRLLRYLTREDVGRYKSLIASLGLRR